MEKKLPLSVMELLLKKAGASRVSESAKTKLQMILDGEIKKITGRATVFSEHAGRKTLKKEDIDLVIIS